MIASARWFRSHFSCPLLLCLAASLAACSAPEHSVQLDRSNADVRAGASSDAPDSASERGPQHVTVLPPKDRLLACGGDRINGKTFEVSLSTGPSAREDVTITVSATYKTEVAAAKWSASLHATDDELYSLRPGSVRMTSENVTTSTATFVGRVPADGANYQVLVGVRADCGEHPAGGVDLRKVVVSAKSE